MKSENRMPNAERSPKSEARRAWSARGFERGNSFWHSDLHFGVWVSWFVNPNGIPAQSPRLPRPGLPWVSIKTLLSTATRLWPRSHGAGNWNGRERVAVGTLFAPATWSANPPALFRAEEAFRFCVGVVRGGKRRPPSRLCGALARRRGGRAASPGRCALAGPLVSRASVLECVQPSGAFRADYAFP